MATSQVGTRLDAVFDHIDDDALQFSASTFNGTGKCNNAVSVLGGG